jgi:ferrous-iron efflux pump FieF
VTAPADSFSAEPALVAQLMRRATYAAIAVQGLLVVVKLGAWIETDSVSMLSALLDSLLDVTAAAANLVAMQQAVAPADREHRFGHGKIEPLASLGQAGFIAGSAVVLMIQALHNLLHPVTVTNTGLGLVVMVFAIVATLGLLQYERSVVRRTGSLLVSGDALHNAGDLALNVGVIISLGLTAEFGWSLIDPLFGGAIALWILYSAYNVAQKAVVQLMDHELPDEARARIRALALAHKEVSAVHDLKTRAAGSTAFIQIHLEMDGAMTLLESHRVADAVEIDIRRAFPRAEIIVHQDPTGVEENHAVFPAVR